MSKQGAAQPLPKPLTLPSPTGRGLGVLDIRETRTTQRPLPVGKGWGEGTAPEFVILKASTQEDKPQ